MERQQQVRSIALVRIFLGSCMFLMPRTAFRLVSLDPVATRLLGRMTGVRDLLLGVGLLSAVEAEESDKKWLLYCAAADAADTLAVLAAYRRLPKRRRFVLLMTALGGAASHAWLWQQADDAPVAPVAPVPA